MILTRESAEVVDGKVFYEVRATWLGEVLHKCGLDVLLPRRPLRMDFDSRTGPVLTVGAHCSVRIVGNVSGGADAGFAVKNAGDLEIVGNVVSRGHE